MKKLLFLAIIFCYALAGIASGQNLILNPSFEFGNFVPNNTNVQYIFAPNMGATITGWSVINGAVDWIRLPTYGASDGLFAIDMIGSTSNLSGTIVSSNFATITSPFPYLVEFDLAAAPWGGASPKTLDVMVDGVTQSFSINVIPGAPYSNPGFVRQSFYFMGSGNITNLTFKNITPTTGYGGPVIDNVSVVLTPEPGTLLLLGSGLLGIGITARIRRKKSYFNS